MRRLPYECDDPWSRGERPGPRGAKGTRTTKLYFRYGVMNSGKSAVLFQAAYNYEERGQRILLARPAVGMKGDAMVASRLGAPRNVDLFADKRTNLREFLGSLVAEAEVQGEEPIACPLIDEAQSPSPAQVDGLLRIAAEPMIPVIAYGIHTDLLTHSFPGSRRLLEVAHSLEELKAICHRGKKAMFNGHAIDETFAFSGEQVTIDGVKIGYETLCPACYFEAGGLLPCETERCHGGAC